MTAPGENWVTIDRLMSSSLAARLMLPRVRINASINDLSLDTVASL
jgi:hypothetical protein